MLWPEALLIDRQRAAIEGLSLAPPVGILEQLSQVVEGSCIVGMFRASPSLHGIGVALRQGQRFGKFAGTPERSRLRFEGLHLGVRLSPSGRGCRSHGQQES